MAILVFVAAYMPKPMAYRCREWNPRTDGNPPTLPNSSQGIFNVPPQHRQGMTRDLRLYVLIREVETMESKVSCLRTLRCGVTAVQWNAVKCITDRNPVSARTRCSNVRTNAESAPQKETHPSSGFEPGCGSPAFVTHRTLVLIALHHHASTWLVTVLYWWSCLPVNKQY